MTAYQPLTPPWPGGALEQRPAYLPSLPVPVPGFLPADAASAAPRRTAFHKADRLAPLGLSTPLLVLGRIWHAHGAAHSVPDATLLGGFAAAAAAVGCVCSMGQSSSPVITGSALAISGGLAAAAVAGYASSIWLPLIAWAAGALTAYGISWRGWRADARREAVAAEDRELKALECGSAERIALINAHRDVRVAEINAHRDVRVAELGVERAVSFEARYGLSTTVAPIDPALLKRSPALRAALAPPQVRVEQIFDYEDAEAERA